MTTHAASRSWYAARFTAIVDFHKTAGSRHGSFFTPVALAGAGALVAMAVFGGWSTLQAQAATLPISGIVMADAGAAPQPTIDSSGVLSAVTLPAAASGVVVSPDGKTGYYVSFDGHSAYKVDLASGQVTATLDLGANAPFAGASDMALTPDGSILFVTSTTGAVTRIPTATFTGATTVQVAGQGVSLYGVAVTLDGGTVIVADHGDNAVLFLDPDTLLPTSSPLQVANDPRSLQVSPDGSTLYVGHDVASSSQSAVVTEVSLSSQQIVATASLSSLALTGVGGIADIALAPDGTHLYAVTFGGDQLVTMTLPDLATARISQLPAGSTNFNAGVAVTPDGTTALVGSTSIVSVIDAESGAVRPPISAGSSLAAIKALPDQAATASFTVSSSPTTGQPTRFDATSTTGAVASYAWDFGDGDTVTTDTPTASHAYASAGAYTATLTTTTTAGTSTQTVFNGQQVVRNGLPGAETSRPVTVKAESAVAVTPPPSSHPTVAATRPTGPGASNGTGAGQLAFTGSNAGPAIIAGVIIVLLGAGFMIIARLRRRWQARTK
jgi:DNA-binding beta-propeller fold protein YncE